MLFHAKDTATVEGTLGGYFVKVAPLLLLMLFL